MIRAREAGWEAGLGGVMTVRTSSLGSVAIPCEADNGTGKQWKKIFGNCNLSQSELDG